MKDVNVTFKLPMIALQLSTIVLFIDHHFYPLTKHDLISIHQRPQNYPEKQVAISNIQKQAEYSSDETVISRTASIIAPAVLILQICLCAFKAFKKQKQSNLPALILLLIAVSDVFLFYQSPNCSFLASAPSNLTENENENQTKHAVLLVLMILGKLTAMLITSLGFKQIRRITHQPKTSPQSSAKVNLQPAHLKRESKKTIKQSQEVVSNKPANKLKFIPCPGVNQEGLQTVLKQKLTKNQHPLKRSKRNSITQDSAQNEGTKQQPQNQQYSSFEGSSSNEQKSLQPNFAFSASLPLSPQEKIDQSQQQPEIFTNSPQQCFYEAKQNIQPVISSLIKSDQIYQSTFSIYLLASQPDDSANNFTDSLQIAPSSCSLPDSINKPTSPTQQPTIPTINQCTLSSSYSPSNKSFCPVEVQTQKSYPRACPQIEQSSTKEILKIGQDIILETVGEDLKKKWIMSLEEKRNQRTQTSNVALNNAANINSSFNAAQINSPVCTPSQEVMHDEQDSTNDESNFNSTNSNQEPLSNTNEHYLQCRTKGEYLDETSKIKTAQFEMFFKQSFQQQETFLKEENDCSESDEDDIDDDDEDEDDNLRQQIQRNIHKFKLFQNSRAAQMHIPNNEDICSDTASTHYQDLLSIADEIKSHLDLDLGDDNSLFSNSLRMKAIDDELSQLESEDVFKKNKKKLKSTEQKKKRRNKRKQMQKEKKQILKETGNLKPSSQQTHNSKRDQICNTAFTNESRSVNMKRLLDENLLEYYTLNVIISQNLSMNVYITDFSQFDYQFDMQSQFYGVDKDTILDSKINFIFEFLSLNLYPTFTPFFHELLIQYASIKIQKVYEQEEKNATIFKCANSDDPQDCLEQTLLSENKESITSSFD